MNMELEEDCMMSDWEAVLELDEALAGWLLQGPAPGEWGWEWGWAASDLQDPDWDTEEIPAVSCVLKNTEGSEQCDVAEVRRIWCFAMIHLAPLALYCTPQSASFCGNPPLM